MSLPDVDDRPRYVAPRTVDRAVLREMVGALLVVLGVIGLGTIAYVVDWRVGAAYTCVGLIASGVLLALDR